MPNPKVSLEEFKAKLDSVSPVDFARLAAFIDGEGCITISSSPRRGRMAVKQHSMSVTVTNTSLLLFSWLQETFGGVVCYANRNHLKPNTLPCWRWVINESQGEEILRRCLPYFIIKQEQAKVALIFRDLRTRRRQEFSNSRVTVEELQQRDDLQSKIVALNSAKGFGCKKAI